MKISAVYIAKNEAHNIARSLESIKDTVDELILVDTGSTDDTVNIFKTYGGQVYYEKWADDFSAPRNTALSKATGDWIILLDADESFSDNTRLNIRNVLEQLSKHTKGLLIRMINFDKDTGKALDEFYALRIVRNIPKLNYKGRIHEMLHIGTEYFYDWQRVAPELLSIDHFGYTASISAEKNRRNIRLMYAAIAAGEPEERYYTSLYETHCALGEMEKALHYARLDVARGRQSVTYASRSYRGLISYYTKVNTPEGRQERLKWVQQAVHDFPELPDFHAEYSECLCQQGLYREAKKEIELALSMFKSYDGLEPCLLTAEMIPLMEKRQHEIAKLAEEQLECKVSVCVIVKNEEKNIGSWLENVKVFADEIIINDTGSEDGTKGIITQFSENNPNLSIVLIESQWQDDFSLAKNQCLEEASGTWIVFTDADELFSNPENIRGYLVRQINTNTQVILVPMANVDQDNNNSIINVFNVPRIFRREANLSYVGRIHEEITINGQGLEKLNTVLADNSLFMEHTGYSSGINQKKAKRNLKLLLKDIEEGQKVERLYRYLAECYYVLENYGRALDNALLATQSFYQPLGHQGDMYWLTLNAMEKLEYSNEDRLAIVENGINLFPELPDFYARKAMLQVEGSQYHEAINNFELAQKKMDQYNEAGTYREASNIMSILYMVYTDWGTCLYKTGHSQDAVEKYQQALKINPWAEMALCCWADVYQGRLDKAFLQSLDNIYSSFENSREILAGVFAVNGFPELAGYFGRSMKDALINAKRYDNIYSNSMKEIAEILPALYVCLLESYNEEYVKLLPDKLQTIVCYFHGKPVPGDIRQCYEEYRSFMPGVIDLGTPELLTNYAGLFDIFSNNKEESERQLIEVADGLLRSHRENLALELYQQVLDDSPNASEFFWQNKGICLFMVGQFEEALQCLGRAVNNKLTDTYIAWCQEMIEDGN